MSLHMTPEYPAEVLREGYHLFLAGYSYREAAEMLAEKHGIRMTRQQFSNALDAALASGRLGEGYAPLTADERKLRAKRQKVLGSRKGTVRQRMRIEAETPDPSLMPRPRIDRSEALYDPNRDGFVTHTSLTAALCGDPLPGRSALDQKGASHG